MSFEEAVKLPRECAPGERLNYSNLGFQALGRVVEKVTGKAYEARLREAILDPLGMKDSGGGWPAGPSEGRATGYLFDPASGGVVLAETSNADPASGGLYSTAEDMARWVKGLLDGRIVSPATLEKAWTPVTLNDGRRGGYGYGFMLIPYRGLREVAHGGDISGFNTYYAIYPTEKLAVVVLSNVGMRPPGPVPEAGAVAHEVADAVAGDRLGPTVAADDRPRTGRPRPLRRSLPDRRAGADRRGDGRRDRDPARRRAARCERQAGGGRDLPGVGDGVPLEGGPGADHVRAR